MPTEPLLTDEELAGLLEDLAAADPDAVSERLVRSLAAAPGVRGAALHERRHGVVVSLARHGDPGAAAAEAATEAVDTGEATVVDGVVAVPLLGHEGPGGALTVAGEQVTPERLRTAGAVARLVLATRGTHDVRREQRRLLAAAFRKIPRISAGTDVRPALQSLIEDAARLIGCAQLVVLERVADGIAPAAGTGVALDVLQAGTFPESAAGRPLDGGVVEPLVVREAEGAPPVTDLVGGPTAVIAVAGGAGAALAVVVGGWPPGHDPDETTVLLTDAVAGLVGLGLATAQSDTRMDSDDLEQTREDFLATLSHELRTPLAVIKGAVETIQAHGDDLPSDMLAELIVRIRRRVDQEVELVETLLSLSRLDRGQLQLHREPFDLLEITRDVATQHMEASGRPVLLEGPEEAPVVADPAAMRQVLSHLVGNALKFGREHAEVTVSRTSRAWRVTVDDDGEGIPPALRDRLFERFVQAAPMSHRAGGVGVGLAVARGLVELHGGRVGVATSPAGGARFWFELPDA